MLMFMIKTKRLQVYSRNYIKCRSRNNRQNHNKKITEGSSNK